jgi:hypothetical protein
VSQASAEAGAASSEIALNAGLASVQLCPNDCWGHGFCSKGQCMCADAYALGPGMDCKEGIIAVQQFLILSPFFSSFFARKLFYCESSIDLFDSCCFPARMFTGYAVSYLFSPVERNVTVRFGGTVSRVFLNDFEVFPNQNQTCGCKANGTLVGTGQLFQGTNRILVKVSNYQVGMGFALRITDSAGFAYPCLGSTIGEPR